jgi:hypothetical protein
LYDANTPAAYPVPRHVPITRALAIAFSSAEIIFPAKNKLLIRGDSRHPAGIE